MVLYSLYKMPLFTDMAPKDRYLRIFVISTVIYIIVHSFLYSSYLNNDGFAARYRHYCYYLIMLDLLLTTAVYLFSGDKPVQKKIKKIQQAPKYPPYAMQVQQPSQLMMRSAMPPQAVPINTVQKASSPMTTTGSPSASMVLAKTGTVVKPITKTNVFVTQADDSSIPLYSGNIKNKLVKEEVVDDISLPIYQSKQVQIPKIEIHVTENEEVDDVDELDESENLDLDADPIYNSSTA
jgi:hypothetical protein